MERDPELDAPILLHRNRLDPALLKAFAYSAAAHVVIIILVLVVNTLGRRNLLPATTYTVGLVDLETGSPLLELGPLGANPPGPRPSVFAPPAPSKAPAPPAPPKAPEPEVAAKPAPPPEPKVEAKPEPKPKPEPKVEAKPVPKPEPKPEPKLAPKVEAKKPEPKPAPKPEPKKAEVKPAPKPAAKAEAKPAAKPAASATAKTDAKPAAKPAATSTAAKPTTGSGSSSTAASSKSGATTVAKAVPPGGGGGGSTFQGTGQGGGGPPGSVVRSPEFVSYYEALLRTIRRGWVTQAADANLRTTVGFSILPDGRLANIRSVESSGDSRFDLSVLNAVRAAQGQLGPPPDQYRKDFSDVEILFRPADLLE